MAVNFIFAQFSEKDLVVVSNMKRYTALFLFCIWNLSHYTLFSNRVTFIRTIEFRIYADLSENFKMLSKLGNFIRLILNLPITRFKIKTLVKCEMQKCINLPNLVGFCLCMFDVWEGEVQQRMICDTISWLPYN